MKIDRRTQLREAAFLLLFRLDFYSRQDMPEQIKDFFEGEDAFTEEEKQAVANKVLAICELSDEIDDLLNRISVGWKVKRMSRVDLTILRLACYEIQYDDKLNYLFHPKYIFHYKNNYQKQIEKMQIHLIVSYFQ